MAGQQFQYDDSGNTFFYFLTSFVGLIVIPATYYLWPRDQNAEQLRLKALRRVHGRCLWYRLRLMKSQQSVVPTLNMSVQYNCAVCLNLFRRCGASVSEIKKQYRVLSLKYHPDKGGDEAMFMKIAKAYSALTNEESRKNWETYGNPDGPRVTSFGIALPAWIVDQKNSMLVLLVYGLAFMVILPVVVGTWWYRSIRYSGDQILINTTQLFMHFMYKTPTMNMKRNLKARVLVLTHLARMEVSENIEEDQRFVVKKCPALLQEMINVGCQLTMMATSRGGFRAPRLTSIENCMKLTQMTVQGLQEAKSPLLQLPHFEEEHLRYCISKKYKVRSLQDLVSLKDSDRRSMLRFLGDEKYDEVKAVLGSLPHITMETKLQVLDDEDSNNITAGSIVTVTVILTRKRMADVFEKDQDPQAPAEEASTEEAQGDAAKNKTKVWQNKSKGAKKAAKSKKKKLTKKRPVPQQQTAKGDKTKQANGNVAGNEVAVVAKEEEEDLSDKGSESDEAEGNKDSPSERDEESDKQSDTEVDEITGDDEEEWEALQQSIQRRERALLETKSKITHPVYSLYFPEEKQEWWWLYIADRKDQTLVSMPYHVCTLKDTEEVELKFPAPSKAGNYQYSVILRSDSYMGLDQIKPLKLEVHEAKAIMDNHPQWDIPETEEEEEDQEDSDGIEESEEDDEDND
uniref:SEC63 homolog, protein translocation regulator n=1 Tax=Astyanax mexicanus TaxID=7994 RepID=A0A8B9K1N4_ASTMX